METEISVLLITQCPSIQKELSQIIDSHRATHVIGQTCIKEIGIQHTRHYVPDVILTDIDAEDSLRNYETIRCLRKISPISKIIILAESLSMAVVFKALQAGAVSQMSNYRLGQEANIIEAILDVAHDRIPISANVANCIIEDLHGSPKSDFSFYSPLSRREMDILHLIKKDIGVEHIAQKLAVTSKQVHKVTYNIIQKLHIENMTQNSPSDWGLNW